MPQIQRKRLETAQHRAHCPPQRMPAMRLVVVDQDYLAAWLDDADRFRERAAANRQRLLMQQKEDQYLVVRRIRYPESSRVAMKQAGPGTARQLAREILQLDGHDVDDVQRPVFSNLLTQAHGQVAIHARDLQCASAGRTSDLSERRIA
jgi:hypothetical protein